MASSAVTIPEPIQVPAARWLFCLAMVAIALASCFLAGWLPLGFSIVTVFLFAGPHNWIEARYFMARMPARWGRARTYYLTGLGGVLLLAVGSAALPSVARAWQWQQGDWLTGVAVWNSALVGWIMLMTQLRQRERGDHEWWWVIPTGFALIAVNWLWPMAWSLGLVYLHPLVAFWFLDRELGRRRPAWQAAYRCCLAVVPLLLLALWWRLAGAGNLPGDDLLSLQIANHAGAGVLSGVSSHLLVSTHTFLEMMHYAVWLVAVPLIAMRGTPWRLTHVPLAKRSVAWRTVMAAVLLAGGLVTAVLWGGFVADYPLTRDIYFSVAIIHVLAEVPFLLRLL